MGIMSENPMDMSKAEFSIYILRDADVKDSFFAWLSSDNATAKQVKREWDLSYNVTLGSVGNDALIPALLPVIGQGAIDRYTAERDRRLALYPPETAMRKYDISHVSGDVGAWVSVNCAPSGATFSLSGEIVTINGTLASPAKEVK